VARDPCTPHRPDHHQIDALRYHELRKHLPDSASPQFRLRTGETAPKRPRKRDQIVLGAVTTAVKICGVLFVRRMSRHALLGEWLPGVQQNQ
jgi:hypothetical protein